MQVCRNESSACYSEFSHSYVPPAKVSLEPSSVGEVALSTRMRTSRLFQAPAFEASQRGSQVTQTQLRRGSHEYEDDEKRGKRHLEGKRRRSRSRDRGKRRREKSASVPRCDEEGHVLIELGSNLTERYKVLDEIGVGTFGKVLECWDRKHKTRVAVKVVRNIKRYRDGAETEIAILRGVTRRSEENPRWQHCCITLLNDFDFYGHVCMSFPLYGLSLYDFIKKNRFKGFSYDLTREIGFQLFASVAWLHDYRLIHTDLKPENILFRSSQYVKDRNRMRVPVSSDIVLIDFGSATFEHEHHTAIVSTRHYRAPEVILGSGWSFECDVWSLGCIMCELLSGEVLFQTHENLEHLALMEKMLGPLPQVVVAEARRGKKYFLEGRLLWPINASSDESVRVVEKTPSLESMFGHHVEFLSLVRGCLTPVKSERLTAVECLSHPYFEAVLKNEKFFKLVPPSLRGKLERQRAGKVVLEGSSLLESEGSPLL